MLHALLLSTNLDNTIGHAIDSVKPPSGTKNKIDFDKY